MKPKLESYSYQSISIITGRNLFHKNRKELLVIVYCHGKVKYLILGSKLNIVTDNHTVTFSKHIIY